MQINYASRSIFYNNNELELSARLLLGQVLLIFARLGICSSFSFYINHNIHYDDNNK